MYRNHQLFPNIRETIPLDLIEEFYSTIIDSITSDSLGRLMWKTHFLGRETVPWNEFVLAMCTFLRLPLDENSNKYHIVYAIVKDIAESDDCVSIETFSKLLEWFGPLGTGILDKIQDIVSKDWFHGNLTHIQAEKLIQRNSNLQRGIFLIRFSSKNRGFFTITVVGRKKSLLHYRVYYNRTSNEYVMGRKTFKSLDDIIRTYNRELSLSVACPGIY